MCKCRFLQCFHSIKFVPTGLFWYICCPNNGLMVRQKKLDRKQSAYKQRRTQLCINTAIVYMHRFYVFHSFTKFHRNVSNLSLGLDMNSDHISM